MGLVGSGGRYLVIFFRVWIFSWVSVVSIIRDKGRCFGLDDIRGKIIKYVDFRFLRCGFCS